MKRIISHYSCLFLVILALSPLVAFAQDAEPVTTVLTNFLAFLNVMIKVFIVIAFLMFGWGIVKLISAKGGGDPQKVTNAKQVILYSIIGIFVLASMGGIITLIKSYTGIADNKPIEIPKFE